MESENKTSKGTQLFNVPNDADGQYFLYLCRKYRQPGWQMTPRGRGQRRILDENGMIAHYDSHLPQPLAASFAVYFRNEAIDKRHAASRARMAESYKAEGVKTGRTEAGQRIKRALCSFVDNQIG